MVVPATKAVGPGVAVGVRVVVVEDRANLPTSLVTSITVDGTVFRDPGLGEDRRASLSHDGHVTTASGSSLAQDDVANLETAVRLVTVP